MYVGKRKSRTRHPGESSDLIPSLNGKYEAWHWIRDARSPSDSCSASRAPRGPSDMVGRLSVGRLHIPQSEKSSTACNCILNLRLTFNFLYTFMYIRWLQYVWGSNIAQIIDILNVLIYRTFQSMMCNEFGIELPCSASLPKMMSRYRV